VGECRDPERFPGSYTKARLASEIGGNTRIRYIGYCADVQNIYRSSDIIVMPSRGDEPFGLITIEAGASCRPLAATREGGVPDVIQHGENGFLADPDDIAAPVPHPRRLIDDEELTRHMGQRARQMVEARFTELPVRSLEPRVRELASRL